MTAPRRPAAAPGDGPAPRPAVAWPIRVGLALTLVLLLAHAWSYRFLTDDAFISFRYAHHLAQGHGLVFNPGLERVEGYSNFLWVLALALLDRVGLPPERAAMPLGLALTAALWVVVVAAAWRRRATLPGDGWLLVPPLLLAATRGIAVWSTSGLETRAFELLVTWGLLRLADETDALRAGRPAGPPAGAILLGLAAITRPDGVLIGGAALGASLLWLGTAGRDPRRWVERFAPWLALAGLHETFRLAYYGSWAPNTYFAKVGGRVGWGDGLEYVVAFALEYGAFLWLPVLAAGVIRAWRSGGASRVVVAGAALAPYLIYVIAIGGDHFEFRPLDLLIPIAALFAAEGLASWAARPGGKWPAIAACGILTVGTFVLPWRAHVDFPRTYSSGFPGYQASAGPDADRFLDPASDPVTRLPLIDTWARLHRQALRRITGRFSGLRQEEHRMFRAMMEDEAAAIRGLIDRGLLPRDVYLATDCVGVVPYRTGARTLDRLGLTDARVAHQQFVSNLSAHGKHASFEYARSRGVDLWFFDPAQLVTPIASSRFMRAWIEAGEQPDGAVALEADRDLWLLAELPQGLESARRRFPRLTAWPLDDSIARAVLRPRAIAAWRVRIAASPDDAEAFDALGYLLMESGRAPEAEEAYRSLVRLRPGDADAAENLEAARRKVAEASRR